MVPFCLFSYQFQLCLNLVYAQIILSSVEIVESPSFGKALLILLYILCFMSVSTYSQNCEGQRSIRQTSHKCLGTKWNQT